MENKNIKNKVQIDELISSYQRRLAEEDKNIQIDIMFVHKKASKRNMYKTWMLAVRNKEIEDMIQDTLENLMGEVNTKELSKYDLELSPDDTVQIIEEKDVINFRQIKDAITLDYNADNTVNDKMDYNLFDFIVIQISDNKKEEAMPQIIIFKKHLKSPAKFKGSRQFILNGITEAKLYDKSLLTISSYLDAFYVDDFFYIVNRNNFNQMLSFKDMYYKVIDANKDQIINADLFDNAEDFINECKNNGRYVTRLTKAILCKGFENIKKNKKRLKQLKKEYELKIEFNRDGKIIYSKDNVDEVLNLILDHYVKSALTSEKLVALAVEKYK